MGTTVAQKPGTIVGRLYLDTLKHQLCEWGRDEYRPISAKEGGVKGLVAGAAGLAGKTLYTRAPFDEERRLNGRDWPAQAVSMMGLKRLKNVEDCVKRVIADKIPGDLVETGVWRGGGAILMRACLEAFGDTERRVWACDSFEGLPAPSLEQDKDTIWHTQSELAVGLEEVRGNFERFGLLDDRVRFLKGWFCDTLPTAPIAAVSVLRLDGDMYASTMDALTALYDRVSPGGFVIVDDYGLPEDTCRRAIHDFADARKFKPEIIDIDGWGAYWRKG